ncbi:hypothetical protein VNI00_016063 [Paramarasmius palmivorus]|uniref:Uncharacterized protein n=1 Tax=Paramarasmius palmivorus TaxID=297713 RepID=A0AAW0BHT1_9AGAR
MPKPNTHNSKMRTRSTHKGVLLTLSSSTPNKSKPTRRGKKPPARRNPQPEEEDTIPDALDTSVGLMDSASTSRPRKLRLSHIEVPTPSMLSPIREQSVSPPAIASHGSPTTPPPTVPSAPPSPAVPEVHTSSPIEPLLGDDSGSDYEASREELRQQRRRKGIQSDSEEEEDEDDGPTAVGPSNPSHTKPKPSGVPSSTLPSTSVPAKKKGKKKVATAAQNTTTQPARIASPKPTTPVQDDGDLYPVVDDDDPDDPPSLKTRGPLPKEVKAQLDTLHEQYLMEVKKVASDNSLPVQRCLDYLKAGIQISPRGVNRYNAFQAFYSHFHPKPDDLPAALYRDRIQEAYNYVRWRNNCLPEDIDPPFVNEVAKGRPGKFVSHPDQPLPEEDIHEMVWYAEWYSNLIDHILDESKVSGSFRAQARKILKPFLALAYNALINNGVHIFGYLIDTRRDANGMSASSIWGNSPDFHEVHAKHRVDIQAQTFDFEAMFRMVEMAKRGRDIPPMYVGVLHEMNDMTRSKSSRDRGRRIMGRIAHAEIKMLTGKECSWNNFLQNAASLQLRLCNWPNDVPFPGLPGGPKECRKGDYDVFLPEKEKWIRDLLDGKISAEQQQTPTCIYFERWTNEERNMSHEDQSGIAIVRMVDGTDYLYARDSESWVTGQEVNSDDEDAEDTSKNKKGKRAGRGRKQSKKVNDNGDATNSKGKAAANPVPAPSGDVFNDNHTARAPNGKGKQKQFLLNSPPNRELLVPDVDDDPRLDPSVPLQDIEDALTLAASSLDGSPNHDESSCYNLLQSYLRPGTAAYRAWAAHFTKILESRSRPLPSADENSIDGGAAGSVPEPQDDHDDNEELTPTSVHANLIALHDGICNGDRHIGDAYVMLDSLLDPDCQAYDLWKAHFNVLNETADDEAVPDPPDVLLQLVDPIEVERSPTPPPITFNEHPSVQLRRLFPKIDLSKHVTTHRHTQGKPARNSAPNIPSKAPSSHVTTQPGKPRPIVPLPARALTPANPRVPSRSHQPTGPSASLIPPRSTPLVEGVSTAPTKVVKPAPALRQVLVGPSTTQLPQAPPQKQRLASKRPAPQPAYIGAPGYKGPTDYFDSGLSAMKASVKRRRLEGNDADVGTGSSKLR